MQGNEVYRVLTKIYASHLHHANSVLTSCTFLEQGGLLSREFVESHNLLQTGQSSDGIDKKYGIWDRIFLDHVDIHDRGGKVRGANYYGPVLFELPLQILLGLPPGSDVLVCKKNPTKWIDNEPNSERWFQTIGELEANLRFGDFDKMLMIKTPDGRLAFPSQSAHVILDHPQRALSSGEDAREHASSRLNAAATAGQVNLTITDRTCDAGCRCIEKYAARPIRYIDEFFG